MEHHGNIPDVQQAASVSTVPARYIIKYYHKGCYQVCRRQKLIGVVEELFHKSPKV